MKSKVLMLSSLIMLAACSQQKVDMDGLVDELYAKMSMEERVAQLKSCYMDDFFDADGNLDTVK